VTRLAWWLQRHAGALALWLGLAAMAAALALQHWELQPLQQRVQRLERAAKAQPGAKPVTLDASSTGPLQQLRKFHDYFQRAPEPTDMLRKLSALAEGRGLKLKRADYVLNAGTGEHALNRYQVVLPLRGPYPVIRGFVMSTLRELPSVSLDQLQLQRQAVGDTELDATLTFTIFYAPR
jgi:hypothetical protein